MGKRLIAFFGADGTGKSTHANLLVNALQLRNKKVRRTWIRSPHTVASLLSKLLMQIGFQRTTSNPYGVKKQLPAVNLNRGIRLIWSLTELLGVMPVILFRVYVPMLFGYTIVAERYVVDTVVNIAYYTNDLDFLKSHTAKVLLHFIPKNTIFLYLDCDYPTLIRRRSNFVEPAAFISFQRTGYRIMGNITAAKYFDTANSSVEEISIRIMDWLSDTMNTIQK